MLWITSGIENPSKSEKPNDDAEPTKSRTLKYFPYHLVSQFNINVNFIFFGNMKPTVLNKT